MQAGIYARISSDPEETTLGVQRQIEDCRAEAERRGWDVVQTYTDNDVSATRSKVRPEYRRMLGDIKARHIQAFIVWDIDRLTRTPRELEDIIDLAEKYGIQLANVGGEIDLSTPQGRMTARIKGTVARHEAEQQSKRLKRKIEQKALAGEPHSQVPFGYMRTREDGTVRDVPNPETAPIVLEAAKRFVSGEALHSIVNDYNARNVPAPRAAAWNSTSLRQLLRRQTNIGMRTHRGELIGRGNVDPIMTEELFEQVLARLNDPERKKAAVGNAPKHLLTSLAKCGLCGHTMRRLRGTRNAQTGKDQPPAYGCKSCFKIRRKQELVDQVVTLAVVGRLQRPDLLAAISAGEPDTAAIAREKIKGLEARLELAADQFADGDIMGPQLKRITERIKPQIEDARRTLEATLPRTALADLAGADAAAKWEAAPLDVKRTIIDQLMTVTILPAGIGKGRDPELIKIDWKQA